MFPPPLNVSMTTQPVTVESQVHVAGSTRNPDIQTGEIRPLWMVEKEVIEHAIASCDGNIPQAAALLELSPSTIYRKRLAWQANNQA
jgi:two-component system repressor protein LuxO